MGISPRSIQLRNLPFENLVAYLELTGWKLARTSNSRWLVFEGARDIDGEPLEIVLPRDASAHDLAFHLANAVNLLAAVTEDVPEDVIKKIRNYDRDVLSIRNLETGEHDSISLTIYVVAVEPDMLSAGVRHAARALLIIAALLGWAWKNGRGN